jgi:hypothetical protein
VHSEKMGRLVGCFLQRDLPADKVIVSFFYFI